ncbi:probable ubiquitin-like-specific protease 2B [Acropora millepora]|uniref:probable ubiquitin-like-specific protease 2B n=1 Tax=Acropora millepora TaxID=45264 RepID=UPI001CF3315B|nr:probable ubiquitin-like-specific protease 2B [Acropora millepora]
MITDTIVSFLFKQLPQQYPVVSSFFYNTLCGEQDVGPSTSRMDRQTSAEKFFKPDLLNSKYVFLPINRSLHWLLAVLTPWHLLILDSLTWDISTRQEEILNINSFLDCLCAAHSITSITRSNHALKVPQQLPGSNNCGFHTFMFADHFLKDLKVYESDPHSYVNAEHTWFDPKDAENKRTSTKTYLEALFQ